MLFDDLRRLPAVVAQADDFSRARDLVWLHTDVGPSYYLDGEWRVWSVDAAFPDAPPVELFGRERTAALVLGARNLSCDALLPPRSPGAIDCPRCAGARFIRLDPVELVCPECSGLGWTTANASVG